MKRINLGDLSDKDKCLINEQLIAMAEVSSSTWLTYVHEVDESTEMSEFDQTLLDDYIAETTNYLPLDSPKVFKLIRDDKSLVKYLVVFVECVDTFGIFS